ncbi:MAG: hypothetical protein QNJ29_11785 [Rhizobiaceae bacterium]|nr:hypothetical protein [Rhizobiaceae bacterium]
MSDTETVSIDGAKATLYRSAPQFDELHTLAVGEIKFASAEAGKQLLKEIQNTAKSEGFGAVLGPLNGDTWHTYRLVFESDGSPPFLLEPTSGEYDLEVFESNGFEPVSMYLSAKAALAKTISGDPVSLPGISVEAWDGENAEALIQQLYDMSTAAFSANRFFTPISFESFLGIYQPMMPFIDKEHVLFARDEEGQLQGFLFGTPNYMAPDEEKSVILKTYASRMRGVGHLLADTYHRKCLDLGFDTVIHALIHETNTSRQRSEMHGAKVFRRYALMSWKA